MTNVIDGSGKYRLRYLLEKLPDGETIEPTFDTPTAEASDGKQYPKEEVQVWEEFLSGPFVFRMVETGGDHLDIADDELDDLSDMIDALHAWKNHILSQEKG